MKKLILVGILLFMTNGVAIDFKNSDFIGTWTVNKKESMDDKSFISMKLRVKYYKDSRFSSMMHVTVYNKSNMQQYNTKEIKFANDDLVVASYLIVTTGKWKIMKDSFIEESESVGIYKIDDINKVTHKEMAIDEEMSDMLAMMMKKTSEKEKIMDMKIIDISKDKINLISNDKDKMNITLIRK